MTTKKVAIDAQPQGLNEGGRPESTEADEAAFSGGYFRVRWGEDAVTAWTCRRGVSPLEAARFLKGQNPEGETRFDKVLPDDKDVLLLAGVFEDEAVSSPARRSLRDWLDVAQQRGLTVNQDMAAIVRVVAHKHQPVQPQAAAPAQQSKAPPEWIEQAQKRAREIVQARHERDNFPSQQDIADEIARGFRAADIVGADGKPLSGAYIKRHALKGISSAKGKQLSTAPRRGK